MALTSVSRSKTSPSIMEQLRVYVEYGRALLLHRTGHGHYPAPDERLDVETRLDIARLVDRIMEAASAPGESLVSIYCFERLTRQPFAW